MTCTAATGLVGRHGDVDAWRERDGGETSVERRPMPLRVPRGARGIDIRAGPMVGSAAAAHAPGAVRHALERQGTKSSLD
jgi:hypothetical protein